MAETFRTKVERTGKTATFLSVPNETVARANREPARVSPDDVVAVTIDHDVEPRVVDVPEDLAAALADDEPTRQAFEALSSSHQREYVEWVTEAKRPETRTRRIAGRCSACRTDGRHVDRLTRARLVPVARDGRLASGRWPTWTCGTVSRRRSACAFRVSSIRA